LRSIADGRYRQGEVIPSESHLSQKFGTSISTIRQALSILVAEKVLEKKQGKGTFVTKKKVRLRFLTWIGESNRGRVLLRGLIERFERKNPSVEIEVVPTTYLETKCDLLRLISAGNAPDVTQIVAPWTAYFVYMGALEPLDGLLDGRNLEDRFWDKDLKGGEINGHNYSVAWGLCPVSLIMNRRVIEEHGLQVPSQPMELEEFDGLCRKLSDTYISEREDDRYCYGLNILNDETDFLRIYTFLQAFGGGFVDDREKVVFNSRENVAGFSWLREFVQNNRIFISDIYRIRKKFAAHRIAFITDGPWIKYLLEELTGEPFERNFQVVLNPVRAGGKSYSWNYNHALAICSQSRNKFFAAHFIDSITSDRELSEFYFSQAGHLPSNKNCLDDEAYDSAYFRAFRRQLEFATCLNAQNAMFEKAMVLCMDAVRKILFEGIDIDRELNEKEYYLNMLYYEEPQFVSTV
jgi:ABC-type glycerol-3-phosphate transport system substrate-binding protein